MHIISRKVSIREFGRIYIPSLIKEPFFFHSRAGNQRIYTDENRAERPVAAKSPINSVPDSLKEGR